MKYYPIIKCEFCGATKTPKDNSRMNFLGSVFVEVECEPCNKKNDTKKDVQS